MTEAADFQPAELERHRAFLQRLARELVRDEGAAQDLVQDAFVRALERPPASAAALGAWLGSVVRRLALNHRRSGARAIARQLRVARPERMPPASDALASLELQELVVGALKALPEPYRSTLWLRYHEGLAPGAIAECLALPKKTVESRLTRGLALLRAELDRRSSGDHTRWLGGVALLARDARPGGLVLLGVAMSKLAFVVVAAVLVVLAWTLATRARAPQSGAPVTLASAEDAQEARVSVASKLEERSTLEPVAASAPSTASGGSLRVRVLWHDGVPAADVGLFVHPEDDPLAERHVVRARTDEAGLAQVSDLHVGRVRVESDRGGTCSGHVASGTETELVLRVPRGIDVDGTVRDRDGEPVAGAEILLAAEVHDWLALRSVARTDALGRYSVRSVAPGMSVGARHEGVASLFENVRPAAGDRARIDLVLDSRTGGLAGVVLDADRRPVAGARVAAGDVLGYRVSEERTRVALRHAFGMPVAVTDAAGRFAVSGVWQSGSAMSVAVLAEGYPVLRARVAQSLGETSFVELELERPCSLRGTVRDAQGAPAEGASVRVLAFGGQVERQLAFPLPSTRTDERGHFRLELLPRGSIGVRVDPPQGAPGGHAFVELEIETDESEVELVLPADPALHGRVEDWTGRALSGRGVEWYSVVGSSRGGLETDAQGRFLLPDASEPPYILRLYDESRSKVVLTRTGASASEEVVIRLEASASVSGSFADEGGLFDAESRPNTWLGSAGNSFAPAWDGERFTFDAVPPGVYRLWMRADERILDRSQAFELLPGEHRELPTVRSARPGALRVELSAPSASGGYVCTTDFEVVDFVRPLGAGLGVPDLPPGEWILVILSDGLASACVPFSIRSDETTRVALTLEPSVARTLGFTFADPSAAWNELRVAVRSLDGAACMAQRIERGEPAGVLAMLSTGSYLVEAETDTGLVARGSFDVPALVPQSETLAFELR